MPRENVCLRGETSAVVGWSNEGPEYASVQLGLAGFPDFHFDEGPDEKMAHSSLWVDLSRKDINDPIRLLRKARDKAYGRDE